MKRLPCPSNALFVSLLLAVLAAVPEVPAESESEKKDPFTRDVAGERNTDRGTGETIIVIGLQLAQVPSEHIRKWDEEGVGGTELRKRVEALVDQGEATIVDSVAGTWRSGNRGKFQSVLELHYPTAFEIIGETFEEPPYPMDFERRDLGIYLEADPVLNEDHSQLDLNFAFGWSSYLGDVEGARTITERTQAGDVLEPHFATQRVVRQATVPIGEYSVLTRIQPQDPEKEEQFDVIVFGRVDLVAVNPIEDEDEVREAGTELRFRASWVEVEADTWHGMLHANSLSSVFGGKAWDSVLEWEKEGTAKVLATVAVGSKSGQRAKVEVGETLNYRNSFPVPGSDPGNNTSTTNWRQLGHEMEFDPVLSESGIIYFNMIGRTTSLHGWGVSYRKKEGDQWVPAVQFPRLYESSATTQVMLGRGANLLVGVGTQPQENGKADGSRKWLLFVHNDTYEAK